MVESSCLSRICSLQSDSQLIISEYHLLFVCLFFILFWFFVCLLVLLDLLGFFGGKVGDGGGLWVVLLVVFGI